MTADPISSALLNETITIAPAMIAEERLMFQWDFCSLLRIANEFKKAEIADPKDVSAMWTSGTVEKGQPKWDLSKPSAHPCEAPRRDRDIVPEEWWQRRDMIAWYVPAHTNSGDYGIHFDAGKVRALAGILKACSSDSNITRDEWLITAILACFWHEVGHAWIEDLVTIAEAVAESAFYVHTNHAYKSYIFMEEALCNTSVTGMVKCFWT
jgi:hypothetical protein